MEVGTSVDAGPYACRQGYLSNRSGYGANQSCEEPGSMMLRGMTTRTSTASGSTFAIRERPLRT